MTLVCNATLPCPLDLLPCILGAGLGPGAASKPAPRLQPGGCSWEGKCCSLILQEGRGIFSTALMLLCAGAAQVIGLLPPPTLCSLTLFTSPTMVLCQFCLSNRGLAGTDPPTHICPQVFKELAAVNLQGRSFSAYHGIV